MALDSYANLKAAIKRLDGSNDLTDVLDDAIDMCESEIYSNADEPLRIRAMEVTVTDSLSTRFLALPANYLSIRSVRLALSNGNRDIRFATPEALEVRGGSGRPSYFTITSQIEFDIVPDSAYTIEIAHYAKPTALSASNTTNAVLTGYPNIYLFGSLWAVNLFNAEEDKATLYYRGFINSIKGANSENKKGRYGPAPTMKFEGMTP